MRASIISKRTPAALAGFMFAASLAACAGVRTIMVHPEPRSFGREYGYDLVKSGRDLAVEHCAACHAIDASVSSPRRGAPPMNAILKTLDETDLGNSMVKGLRLDHHMPAFDFNVVAADALLAYLEAITPPDRQ